MTVQELINQLYNYPADLSVLVQHGAKWNTEEVNSIESNIEEDKDVVILRLAPD